MLKKTELTIKQRKFIQHYLLGQKGVDAVINAGYNPKNRDNAAKIAYQLLNQTPTVQRKIKQSLDAADLTEEVLVQHLREIIESSKGSKTSAHVALRAIELAFRLHGLIPR